MYSKVILKEEKENFIYRRHKWIFSGAIKSVVGKISDGEIVKVVGKNDKFLAVGQYYNSSISVRILSFEDVLIDDFFWEKRLNNAYNYRKNILGIPNNETNAFRLVFGESDGLPGLIIDVYDDVAVIQCHTVGMEKSINQISKALLTLPIKFSAIYRKSPNDENKSKNDGFIYGSLDKELVIFENLKKFLIDFETGQKTGFFIDQKVNREILQTHSSNKRILNLFSYTGGFTVYSFAGGAKEVVNVDVSENAIKTLEKNVNLNYGKTKNNVNIVSDCFDFLSKEKSKFDIIIVDPPAFAKNINKLDNAVIAYRKLNESAMRLLNPGGLLFTFSCSQVVSREKFQQAIFVGATNMRQNLRIVNNLYQSPDHPIDLFQLETNYLKGFVIAFE